MEVLESPDPEEAELRSSTPSTPHPARPRPATPSGRGGAGCEVSSRGACAVGSGARGGGFITTSSLILGFYLWEGG